LLVDGNARQLIVFEALDHDCAPKSSGDGCVVHRREEKKLEN